MLKKLKKNKKKGFTLVELIVVLVILAILAALLIPALTKYIDKAKEKSITAETRQVVMAAQTLVDEQYAKVSDGKVTVGDAADDGVVTIDEIKKLAEVEGTITFTTADITDGKINKLIYKNGKTCTYTYTATTGKGSYEVK